MLDQESANATTEDDGWYSIPGVKSSPSEKMSPLLSASKPGYFTAIKFAASDYSPILKDTTLELQLDAWRPIAVGEIVVARVEPTGELACSHWGYGTSDCQRFAVTVPSSGILDIGLSARVFRHDVDIVGPDGTFILYDPSWKTRLHYSIQVTAGSTYEIRVAFALPEDFELTTALRAGGGSE